MAVVVVSGVVVVVVVGAGGGAVATGEAASSDELHAATTKTTATIAATGLNPRCRRTLISASPVFLGASLMAPLPTQPHRGRDPTSLPRQQLHRSLWLSRCS